MTKQPAYIYIRKRVVGSLENSDKVMNDSFWIRVWPGLDNSHMQYICKQIELFVKSNS